jgi:hypothetical protein
MAPSSEARIFALDVTHGEGEGLEHYTFRVRRSVMLYYKQTIYLLLSNLKVSDATN